MNLRIEKEREEGFTQPMREVKERLDNFINKQRVAMYKPVQVAEILYRVRTGEDEMSLDKLSNSEKSPA